MTEEEKKEVCQRCINWDGQNCMVQRDCFNDQVVDAGAAEHKAYQAYERAVNDYFGLRGWNLAEIIELYDPVAYETGFQQWCRDNNVQIDGLNTLIGNVLLD